MNLTAALQIPGFTNERELEWLAKQASSRMRVVEIGSWKGRSTRAIADNLPAGGAVYAVDTWKGTPEDPHFKELVGKPENWLIREFARNVGQEHVDNRTVRIIQQSSVKGALYLGYQYLGGDPGDSNRLTFDMIFIDAAHDYQSVKEDVLAWQPLLKPGGLLCGHDYAAGRGGVVAAVNDVLPKARPVGVGTIWAL